MNAEGTETYDGPASRTRTWTLGFSVSLFAMTFPAVPPGKDNSKYKTGR